MNEYNKYIRFDWAAKRMLRDKANFDVLEGLMTVLIGEDIRIEEILESESNQESATDKFNRVDVKARNSKGEIIIVEVQLTREIYYLERILYGVSKAITEHIKLGEMYNQVRKVYSINILYFDLGQGTDYLYHGTTRFVGVHTGDTLQINSKAGDVIRMKSPEEIFPEYYLIRVNQFNEVAKTPIEEWMDYLKNGNIKDDTKAPGLQAAKEKLRYLSMDDSERRAYDHHIDNIMVENDVLNTKWLEGIEKGRAEGIEKGRAEGIEKGRAEGIEKGRAEGRSKALQDVARNLKDSGLSPEMIAQCTGLTIDEVLSLS